MIIIQTFYFEKWKNKNYKKNLKKKMKKKKEEEEEKKKDSYPKSGDKDRKIRIIFAYIQYPKMWV